MSHRAFFDALHAAKVRITTRDEMAADVLADRDPVECPECGGTGLTDIDGPPCIYCSGKGYWLGAI